MSSGERTEISVIGAGGLAKQVIAALRAGDDYEVVVVYDDEAVKHSEDLLGIPILPRGDAEDGPDISVLALADNAQRQEALQALEFEWLSVVHPFSWVAPTASLGLGAIVCAGAVIQPDTVLGPHCLVEGGAVLGNDVQLEAFARVGVGARVSGAVWLGEGCHVGAGAVVTDQRRIGAWSVIGPGAVVDVDVADGAAFVPARGAELRLPELDGPDGKQIG